MPKRLATVGFAVALAAASVTALAQHGGGKGRGGPGRAPPAQQPRFERVSPPPSAPGPQQGRMSPEQRQQLRRDIQDANRNLDRR